MKVKNKKKIVESFLIVWIVLISCYLVSAVAVSGVYSEDRPLEIYPGEAKTISFILQNMAGDSDVKFKASVTEGSEVVRLTDINTEYLVPLGNNNVPVEVLVEIPEGVPIGTEYMAKIEFKPTKLGNEKEGMVQIALGLSRYFKIKVVEKSQEKLVEEEKISIGWIMLGVVLVVAVVAVIIIIYFIIKRVKGRKKDIENEET